MQNLFLEVQGQKSALNLLSELYTRKKVPHAFLFTGIEGCGKFLCALEFLKIINKSSKRNLEKIEKLQEPYIKLILPLPRGKSETNTDSPTGKLTQDVIDEINNQISIKSENPYHKIDIKNANNIKINSVREINKIVSLNFDEIEHRGIILQDAHKMTIEAQNAFLKNLEEPPEGIIYFLITDNPDMLLETIRSRCWRVNFSPLQENDMREILTKRFHLSDEKIGEIIPFADGSVTKALFLYENDLETYLHKTILILRYSLAGKYFTAFKEFNELISHNSVETFEIVIDLLIAWFNDTLKEKYNAGQIQFQEHKDTLKKFNSRFGKSNLADITAKLAEFRNAPRKNVALNLISLNVIFELASIGIKGND